MMKKSRSLIKVVACLAASFTILVGNPLMTKASWFSDVKRTWNCMNDRHYNTEEVCTHYATSCKDYDHYEVRCVDCHCVVEKWMRKGQHCWTTDPYSVPTCTYCGVKKWY